MQKKIVRIITFSAFLAHTAPIFQKLRLLPLCKIVLQRTSVFMFKLMNNMLPLAMNSQVVRNNDIHQYNTRQNHHLRGSRPTCKTVVNSFTNRSFQIWNAISSQVNINVSIRDGTKPIPSTRSIGYRVIFKVSVSAKNPIPIPSTFRYYFDTFSILYMHVYYNKLQWDSKST